jgi:acetoin utilization deacetylase AcuC-like enzyme
VDRGEGFTLNIPLPAETGENRYVEAFKEEINPRLLQFKPEMLFLSAGFDAHKDDPLGGMRLTENSFAKMTTLVRDIAPVVSVLEGGYNLDALAHSVHEHLIALAS